MKKRILSILLALIMVISLLPTVAFAASACPHTNVDWHNSGDEEHWKSCTNPDCDDRNGSIVERGLHTDANADGNCDDCSVELINVTFDYEDSAKTDKVVLFAKGAVARDYNAYIADWDEKDGYVADKWELSLEKTPAASLSQNGIGQTIMVGDAVYTTHWHKVYEEIHFSFTGYEIGANISAGVLTDDIDGYAPQNLPEELGGNNFAVVTCSSDVPDLMDPSFKLITGEFEANTDYWLMVMIGGEGRNITGDIEVEAYGIDDYFLDSPDCVGKHWFGVGEAELAFFKMKPLNASDEPISPITIEIPFTKEVKQGGNQAPKPASFEFEALFPFMSIENTTISATIEKVNTSGAKKYPGKLVITVSADELGALDEGFILKEKAGSEDGWTYDETIWHIMPVQEDVPSRAAQPAYNFYKAVYVEGEGDSDSESYYDTDYESGSFEEIVFTNTYTEYVAATADIVIKKIDGEGEALPGAKFVLENDDNEYEKTSDAYGLVTFEDVEEGHYTLREVEAPEGYNLNRDTWNFNVSDDGTVNGFSEEFPNGYVYSNERPLEIVNEKIPTITIEIPVTKEVVKGGNKDFSSNDGVTFEFEVEILNSNIEEEVTVTCNQITVTNKYGGSTTIEITVPAELYYDLWEEGIMLTEKSGSAEGWTYDKTAWIIAPALRMESDEEETTAFNFYKGVYVEGEEGGVAEGYHEFDYDNPAEKIVFTNTYTKNSSGGGSSAPSRPVLNKEDHVAFMQGYPDGTFGTKKNITRAEAAVMFARLITEKMDADKTYTNTFTDVDSDAWYYNYIGYMQKFGIINGYEDGSFRPDAPITRAEFAAIACRFEELTKGEAKFSDVTEDHWAYDYINFAAARGWVTGYEDGTFKPGAFITREEVVAVTCRLLERSADQDYVEENIDSLKRVYSDVTKSDWSYWYVIEASNGHDYTKEDGKETWTDLH